MGTIFVAYGEPEGREAVLEFAVGQAAASSHDLYVYHIQETEDESSEAVRDEVRRVVRRTDPDVQFEVRVETKEEFSDETNVAKPKLLTDEILGFDRDLEYVVMGEVERSSLEEIAHASMTRAVLETHAVPVLLVPI